MLAIKDDMLKKMSESTSEIDELERHNTTTRALVKN